MRLIDVDELKGPKVFGRKNGKHIAYYDLSGMPIIDALPVVHGTWQGVTPFIDTRECSVCHYCIPSEEFKTPFCPWCGAKMDGGAKNG